MGVDKEKRQVAQPYSQTAAGSTAIGAFLVNGSANSGVVAVTTTAKTITIVKSGAYTVHASTDCYWEVTAPPAVGATASVTAADSTSPTIISGERFNFYFQEGQKISIKAQSTNGNVEFLPSVQ